MLNKVPEITLYFWVIKILCTTVGETAADLLNENLGLGLTNTTYIMAAALIAVLVFQFRSRKYVPGIYWLAVVLISVVGTLFSDNLVDNLGVELQTTTIAFSVILACVFGAWYWSERTLSVHTIVTTRREAFYWLAILFTFALGTSAGDLVAEKLELGYLPSVGIFAGAIASSPSPTSRFRLNAILAFWIAYILTRPLGASIGDYLSSAGRRNRPRPGDDPDQRHLPQRDPRPGRLPDDLQARPDRGLRRGGPAGRVPGPSGLPSRRRPRSSSSPTRSRPPRPWSTRCASAPPPGRRGSSCWFPTPTTCRSTATAPTPPTGSTLLERALPRLKAEVGGGGRGPGRQQPQRLRRHRRRARHAASTGRSSSRRRPATSPTGCTSTSRSGSPSSATR